MVVLFGEADIFDKRAPSISLSQEIHCDMGCDSVEPTTKWAFSYKVLE
jgi:hypothetical protein